MYKFNIKGKLTLEHKAFVASNEGLFIDNEEDAIIVAKALNVSLEASKVRQEVIEVIEESIDIVEEIVAKTSAKKPRKKRTRKADK